MKAYNILHKTFVTNTGTRGQVGKTERFCRKKEIKISQG